LRNLKLLLVASRLIDHVNELVGRAVSWLTLAAVLISAGNALLRYGFNLSSNAWLEIQWYLFSAVFLLAAGYTLRHDEHVRIDVVISKLSPRVQAWIDIFGGLFFLLPMALLLLVHSWPVFVNSYVIGEVSSDAGGLIRWPVKFLMPLGLFLLILQALSEIVKRLAYLKGLIDNPLERKARER
jgi:TRAP-type mannitol/chloroaromatic compound transport system permease small subunit